MFRAMDGNEKKIPTVAILLYCNYWISRIKVLFYEEKIKRFLKIGF